MIVAVVIAAWLLGVLVGLVIRDARRTASAPLERAPDDGFDLDWDDPRRSSLTPPSSDPDLEFWQP